MEKVVERVAEILGSSLPRAMPSPTERQDYFLRQRVKRFGLIPIFGALRVEKDEFYRSAPLETSCPRRFKREVFLE